MTNIVFDIYKKDASLRALDKLTDSETAVMPLQMCKISSLRNLHTIVNVGFKECHFSLLWSHHDYVQSHDLCFNAK